MNLKKLLFLCLIFTGQISYAQIVSKETAKTVATNFLAKKKNVSINKTRFEEDFTINKNFEPVYYVFNVENNNGWIIISADEIAFPIIAYNLSGHYENDPGYQPIQFKEWMENCSQQIVAARNNVDKANNPNKINWNYYLNELPTANVGTRAAVAPLLGSITWNQNQGWNKYAPADAEGPGNHAYIGCVATATGQILKYWHHPRTGTGSRGYTDGDSEHTAGTVDTCAYGYLSVDYSTKTWDYTKMHNSAPTDESSEMLYHLGIGVAMDYCHSGSASTTSDVVSLLETNLYYNTSASYVSKSSYTDANWNNLLKGEFDAGRPVVYRGTGAAGGHAFVCDGYDDNYTGLGLHFHFNWGWTGSNDGFYLLTDLTPGSYDFGTGQACIKGITPLTTTVPYSDFIMSTTAVDADMSGGATSIVAGNTMYFYDQSTFGPGSYSWTFQGGTPATSTSKNPTVVFSYPGIYTVTLVATNATGAGSTQTKTIVVYPSTQTMVAATCSPTTSSVSTYRGIKRFLLEDIDSYTGTSSQDNWYYGGTGYLDLTSKSSTDLLPGTLYNYTIDLGCDTYKEYYAIYIDYNNDGDFSDANEEVYKSGSSLSGVQNGSFTTIASPTLNTPLRLRVVSSYATIIDACNSTGYAGMMRYGQAEDHAVYFKTTASTWSNSAASTTWGTAGNWSNSWPGIYTDVTIDAGTNQPVLDADLAFKSVTINPEASLTINSSKKLTLTDNLLIKSSANGTGSFIDNGTYNVMGTTGIEQYIASGGYGIYLSPAISNGTSNQILGVTDCQSLYRYNAATAAWVSVSSGTGLTTGTGYVTRFSSNQTPVLTGTFNTGDKTINTFVRQASPNNFGWNLAGNPYPSSFNWGDVSRTNINNAIYFRKTNGTIASFVNGVGNPGGTTGVIPPNQSFWVQVTSGQSSGSITIPNTSRSHGTVDHYKTNDPEIFRLSLSDGSNTDETVIRFSEQASEIFDPEFDAYKIFAKDNSIPQIYSLANNPEEFNEFSINSIPYPSGAYSIPVGIKVNHTGNYTLQMFDFNNVNPMMSIILEDKGTNTFTNLTDINSYSFTSDSTLINNRFVIHLELFVTNTEDGKKEVNELYISDNTLYINSDNNSEIEISDMAGRIIATEKTNKGLSTFTFQNSGAYLVKTINGNEVKINKVVIK